MREPIDAGCCRAMHFRWAWTLAEFREHIREDLRLSLHPETPEDVRKACIDNLRFAVNLEPLPLNFDEWPEESRRAMPGPPPVGRQVFRCRLVGADGLCTIYHRRPYICSDFVPVESECALTPCASWCSETCSCRPSALRA